MKKLVLSLLLFVSTFCLIAQEVTTISIYSEKMQKSIDNIIVLPEGYDAEKSYPVLYLLHGYGGNHTTWVAHTKKTLPTEASKYNMIVVCPDGQNSWYWDSPIDSSQQFETYVSEELVSYVDANYNTIKSSKGRAVTGFSMGGHGGLWLAINHPDVFGACGSMSGGVDIRPFPNSWEMKKCLGNQKENAENWENHTVINQLHKIEPNSLAIIIDCGYDDFFYHVNEKLHEEMLYLNISHEYYTRPGKHEHKYWANSIDYQLLFFNKFFTQNNE